jgi:hypothetical protein
MHEVKAHRLAADRLFVVRRREKVAVSSWVRFRMRYPAERLLPSGTDVLTWEQVKAIIELPSTVPTKDKDAEVIDCDVVTKDEVEINLKPKVISPASFTSVFESMTAFISNWEDEKIRTLDKQNTAGPGYFWWDPTPSQHLHSLQLAACVFTCEDKYCIHRVYEHYQNGAYPTSKSWNCLGNCRVESFACSVVS